jgi:hypothetical protein
LKALTTEEAWAVAAILEDLLDSIWHTHGHAMTDYQGCLFPDWDPAQDGNPQGPDPSRTKDARNVDF